MRRDIYPVGANMACSEAKKIRESDARRKLVRNFIFKNRADIFSGRYTAENLRKDAEFNTQLALRTFLQKNFLSHRLSKIAANLNPDEPQPSL